MLELSVDGLVGVDGASSDISSLAHETPRRSRAGRSERGQRNRDEGIQQIQGCARTISILRKEMMRNPSLLQKKIDIRAVPTEMIDATAISCVNEQKLVVLAQSKQ